MGQLVVIAAPVILILCVALMALLKLVKKRKEFHVEATYEGKNEFEQAIMKVYFTFSIGKLSSAKKEMVANIKWSEEWKPISYNLKERGTYREERILSSNLKEPFITFKIDAENAVDEHGNGEGYIVLALDCPINTKKSTVAVIIDIKTKMTAYQLSDSTSWDNELVVHN